MLPVMGLVLMRVSLFRGMAVTALIGAIGGLIYGAVFRRPPALWWSIVSGIVFGVALWVGGAMFLVPVILGFPPFPAHPLDQIPTLVAFVAYGLVLALTYSSLAVRAGAGGASRREGHRMRLAWIGGMSLIFLAAGAAVAMLYGARTTDPAALQLPDGYRAEVVLEGFTYPTSLAVAPDGTVFVGESGYSYGPKMAVARVLALSPAGQLTVVAEGFEGPLNGLALKDGYLYVSHRGKVTVVPLEPEGPAGAAAGGRRDLVTGLPSLGDHHNNELAFGPDGMLYLGQGSATNAGVVGSDNFVYAWADRYPEFHDQPSRDFVLTGRDYSDLDLRTAIPTDRVSTGAFAPFGTTREEGARVQGQAMANGAILRIDPSTGGVSVYADGFRNPYGLAFGSDGELYATNLGYDDRGVRAVRQSPDWVVRVKEGAWYGWPDFAGTRPLADAAFGGSRRGVDLEPLIASPPPVEPPLADLPPHASPMKLAVSPGGAFGDEGGLYVAVFGDAEPLVENLAGQLPTGIIRVDPASGETRAFLQNKTGARAGRYGAGMKRAIACAFTPDGSAMYVLDFGQIDTSDLAPNPIPRTGVLWRITR